MKNIVKKVFIICIVWVFTMAVSANFNVSKALSWSEIQRRADGFIAEGSREVKLDVNKDDIKDTVNTIGQILTTIGVGIILVSILILGIKYMVASPEEAAKIKKQLVGLVISGVVIFGAYGIWTLVFRVLINVT